MAFAFVYSSIFIPLLALYWMTVTMRKTIFLPTSSFNKQKPTRMVRLSGGNYTLRIAGGKTFLTWPTDANNVVIFGLYARRAHMLSEAARCLSKLITKAATRIQQLPGWMQFNLQCHAFDLLASAQISYTRKLRELLKSYKFVEATLSYRYTSPRIQLWNVRIIPWKWERIWQWLKRNANRCSINSYTGMRLRNS